MKKIIPVAVLFLLFAAMASAGEEYLADTDFEPLDFRGIKWQESLDGISGMNELYREDDGSQVICSREGDELRLGSAELASIEYIFWDGKLSEAAVAAVGEENRKALLDEAKSMYGRETLKMGDTYMWRFTNVMVMYGEEPNDQSVLYYRYIGFLNN